MSDYVICMKQTGAQDESLSISSLKPKTKSTSLSASLLLFPGWHIHNDYFCQFAVASFMNVLKCLLGYVGN